jgi:prepilin-type processing-associated H-X9-DG protein
MNKKGLTLLELLALVIIIGILAAIILPVFTKLHDKPHRLTRVACADNLKQLVEALYLYAQENKDRFPPIDDTKNNFIFDANLLYPEYLTDHLIAVCTADRRRNPKTNFRLTLDHPVDGTPKGQVHPDCFNDDSYVYLGWLVDSNKEVESFFKAYDKLSPNDYDTDIIVPEGWGNAEGGTIHRLYGGVDRWLVTDINTMSVRGGLSEVALVWDRPFSDTTKLNHRPAGGNVLYMDGHVDYWSYGMDFPPLTETMARLLDKRPREPIPHCE